MSKILQKENLFKILLISTVVNVFFMPISYNGTLPSTFFTILQWLLLIAHLCLGLYLNKNDLSRTKILSLLLIYMGVVTFIITRNKDFSFNVARLIPVVSLFLLLTTSKATQKMEYRKIYKLLNWVLAIIVIVNVMTLAQIGPVMNFIECFYTQFYEQAVASAFLRMKPVFTFGVHNVAAFFYMILFFYFYLLYYKLKNKFIFINLGIVMIFTYLLRSNQSLLFICLMAVLLVIALLSLLPTKKMQIIGVFLIILVAAFITPYDHIIRVLLKESNGIIPRYLSENTIFATNYKVLAQYPLGIGFSVSIPSIPIYYADSGIIVLYTMGAIPFLLGTYYILVRFTSQIFNKRTTILYLIIVLLMELSMPSLIYYKAIYVHLLTLLLFSGHRELE